MSLAQPARQCPASAARGSMPGTAFSFSTRDLRDYISLQNAVEEARPDYVFHLAAQSYPSTSFTSPLDTLDTNIQGTERLLEALRKCKGIDPLIHVCASSEVYGRVPKEKVPINEECTFHPASPYAISKVGTDLVGRFHAEAYGQKVMTTRMFTHTGPRRGDVFAESTFAKQIAMIEAGQIPPVLKVGQPRFVAHLVRCARRGACLLPAADRKPDSGRLLQHWRQLFVHGARHAVVPAVRIDAQSHLASRPTQRGCVQSTLTCRFRTRASSRLRPAGGRKSRSRRPCRICSTTGGAVSAPARNSSPGKMKKYNDATLPAAWAVGSPPHGSRLPLSRAGRRTPP